jgi:glycosyltransferase involved in cell wall biosynthesis
VTGYAGPQAVTPYGRTAGSSRVRVFSWLDRVPAPVRVHSYLSHRDADPGHLLRHPRAVATAERELRRLVASRPPALLLHREASPLSRGGVETALLSAAGWSVYDIDDALHTDTGEGPPWRRLAPKAPKALAAARHADRVIAGNEILADWASAHARDVVVIPSCVDPADYRAKQDHRVPDPPVLGWIGSADNEALLATIGPALREVHRRTGARLALVGSDRPTLGDLEPMIDRTAWSPASQRELLATMDVGLMPLRDDPYSRGKCGYKLLQYAAAGVPAVGSPVGTNRSILSALGLPAATSPDEWVDAVLGLLEDATESRAALGRQVRDVVTRHYSYAAWQRRWEDAVGLSDAAGPRPGVSRSAT